MSNPSPERARLSRRIALIPDQPTLAALRKYRRTVNTRRAILERGVPATTSTGPRGTVYQASDEVALCHAWLDAQGVPACRVTLDEQDYRPGSPEPRARQR